MEKLKRAVNKFLRIIAENKIAFLICLLFFIAYSTLSVIRHLHFGSYGFDLGISDQVVWQYSHFKEPITTIHYFVFTSILTDHFELIYALISPFYWIYSNPITLLLLQAFMISFSGIPIYLLAKEKKINKFVLIPILVSYLSFYGIQNALWFDVHSLVFGAAFLSWFIYFLEIKNRKLTLLFFILTIICKEDMALFTGLIALIYFIRNRDKFSLLLIVLSGIYLYAIFYIFYPHFTHDGYRYQKSSGLFSDLKISYLYDTLDKRNMILYSVAWFGFVPLLAPLFLLPPLGDFSHYFIVGHLSRQAETIFLHYRVTLAPLLIFPTIIAIAKFKLLNNKYIGIYLLICAAFFQFYFHLPLSYLSKHWFWKEPASVKNINSMIKVLPKDSSVVAQNNITPHISQRKEIFTLYPTSLGKLNWFRWTGNPEYLIVDTSTDWDERSFFINRESYIDGLKNLETNGMIKKYKEQSDAVIYKVLKRPE